MSTIPTNTDIKPFVINKFLGLNLTTTGDTQILDGESGNMSNFVITDDYKLRKCNGYRKVYDFGSQVKGTYTFNNGGEVYLLIVANGNLYKIPQSTLDDDTTWSGKNLFDKDNANIIHAYLQGSTGKIVAENNDTIVYIPCEPNTTYTIQKTMQPSSTDNRFRFGTTQTTPQANMILDNFVYNTDIDKNRSYYTYTTGNNASYLVVYCYTNNADITQQQMLDTIQIELGDQATPYEPYKALTPTLIGSVGDYDTTFFSFDKKVYLLNGHKYYSYDGTTLAEVDGYTPLVYVNTPPTGGGTEYDPINMISAKKHMTFNADGTSDTYQLAEKGIDSVDKVIVNGTEVASTGYSVNTANGTVTFSTIPTSGMDNVDIYWSKNNNTRSFIEGMRAGIVYGGDVDTKVFLYGNENEPNRIRFSATAGGAPSVEYFPATNQVDIGPSNFAVTDLTRQYDRLIATTNKPEAYTIGIDLINVNGYETPSVVTLPLNEVHGNVAFAQGQVINNDPVTIENGQIIRWKSTTIRDERNMEVISEKIKDDLVILDMKYVKTCDFQDRNQLWLALGNKVYIYNYFNKTYSRLMLPIDSDLLQVVGKNMYITSITGVLYKFDDNYQTFDDEIINAHWEMNFSNFGMSYQRKTMRKLWVLLQPQTQASAEIGYITNRNEAPVKKTIYYKLTFFDNVDFSDFTFKVSINPQPFRLKLKAKKFTNLKITIDNDNEDDCTILELALKLETNGESK